MSAPLADRMRPRTLDEIVGQQRWLSPGSPLRTAVEAHRLRSMVLWGPPGCGKTTLARALAHASGASFAQMSAVLDGVKELRAVIDRAAFDRHGGKGTVLFVDEIHRWNKGQQDALLPHVESGDLVLIGATTENPSFELNAALRSRLQIIALDPLGEDDVAGLLSRALSDERGLAGRPGTVDPEVVRAIARAAAGDARRALDDLERVVEAIDGPIDLATAQRVLQRSDVRHDRAGEDHYNVMSALIKSLRGSDPDAAIYWLARLVAGGEDPVSIARRLVIFASEDIGNADPRGLQVAVAAGQAVQLVGMPEGRIVLAQAVTWLATCPKSNAAYLAIDRALADVRERGALPVPKHLRNAVTREMRAEGYGDGYRYPHDFPGHVAAQRYLPDGFDPRYYEPTGLGEEKVVADRMQWFEKRRRDK